MVTIGFASQRVAEAAHYKVYEILHYALNGQHIMTLAFENEIAEHHHMRADHTHFRFTTVEEFHNDADALAVLDQLDLLVLRHSLRMSEHHYERHDDSYRGKFSFTH